MNDNKSTRIWKDGMSVDALGSVWKDIMEENRANRLVVVPVNGCAEVIQRIYVQRDGKVVMERQDSPYTLPDVSKKAVKTTPQYTNGMNMDDLGSLLHNLSSSGFGGDPVFVEVNGKLEKVHRVTLDGGDLFCLETVSWQVPETRNIAEVVEN